VRTGKFKRPLSALVCAAGLLRAAGATFGERDLTSTLLGVATHGHRDQLIAVEAMAAITGGPTARPFDPSSDRPRRGNHDDLPATHDRGSKRHRHYQPELTILRSSAAGELVIYGDVYSGLLQNGIALVR
jgi:hypothetical protein